MGRVIAISEALGSGAPEIARIVSDRLGIPVVDREVFLWAATEAGVSPATIEEAEQARSLLGTMVELMGSYLDADAYVESGAGMANLSMMSSGMYRELIQGVIESIADTSEAVILGHGSHVILKDYPNVLRVYLSSPRPIRAGRVGKSMNLEGAAAEKFVRENDVARRNYFEEHLKVRRNEAQNYDLCLRTEKLSFEVCADLICASLAAAIPESEPATA